MGEYEMNTKSTTVPFLGFYESMHMDWIDYSIESEMESADLTDIRVIDPNYRQMMVEYSKSYVSWWFHELKQHIKMVNDIQYSWVELNSPKEYNFTTDRIFVDISVGSLAVIHDYVVNCLWDEFADYVRYALMPRSGFIPFYTNKAVNWGDLSTWDHNQIGLMLSFLDTHFEIEQDGEFHEMASNAVNHVGLGN
jgi:hypothetical protein